MTDLDEVKTPTFNHISKMKCYDIIFDSDIAKARCGFIKYKFIDEKIDKNMGDFYWVVEPGFEHRMDLISFKFYGTARYDWVLEQINNIKDPIRDITTGTRLKIFSEDHMLVSA
jgi:hypothetical protein